MPTIKQLEALYWISELGTFERAAKHLKTTQSAISKRIQELEDSATTPLFDRSRRGAGLTARGESIREVAERMLLLRRDALDRLGNSTEPPSVRLGITELTAITWLPTLVTALQDAFPKCRPEPEMGSAHGLRQRLAAGELDVAIVPMELECPDDPKSAMLLGRVEFEWLASPTLSLGGRCLTVADLSDQTLLVQDERRGAGRWLSAWRTRIGLLSVRVVQANNLLAPVSMAASGLGVANLPKGFAAGMVGGLLQVLRTDFDRPSVPYILLRRPDDFLPKMFAEHLERLIVQSVDFTRSIASGVVAEHGIAAVLSHRQ